MGTTNRTICTIIPIDVLEKIEKNGSQAQKDSARKTLVETAKLSRRRNRLAPVPQPHAEGENREVYDAENKEVVPGKLVRTENGGDTGDQTVDETFHGSGNFYRLLLSEFKRSSFDGEGGTIKAVAHYGIDYDNAFWDGEYYVEGDGKYFNSFSRDLTVPTHELGHALIEHTGGLLYRGQSGALNEHLADVIGCLSEQYAYVQAVDQASWLIGQLICEGKIQSGSDRPAALRNMLNPGTAYDDNIIGKDPQPSHMDDLYTGFEDNQGVHINSGIPNRAFTLAAKEVGGFAWETVGQVWYVTLTTKVGAQTQFQEFANATLITAREMFGAGGVVHPVVSAILNGWDAVGIDAEKEEYPIPDTGDSPCFAMAGQLLADAKFQRLLLAAGRMPGAKKFIAQLNKGMENITKKV